MNSPTQIFTIAEKLAIVRIVDSLIHIDGKVHSGELDELAFLMKRMDFDSNFIIQARIIEMDQGLAILKKMPMDKKNTLAEILTEMAHADGFVHLKEMDLILEICSSLGIGIKLG